MSELNDQTYDTICQLCEQGDTLADDGQYAEALDLYWQAWDLLPEPKTDWEAATWILAAIGDADFLSSDFAAAHEHLSHAMFCPDAIGNPFLHLRLGQAQFELGVEINSVVYTFGFCLKTRLSSYPALSRMSIDTGNPLCS